jgi:hypothetical protein
MSDAADTLRRIAAEQVCAWSKMPEVKAARVDGYTSDLIAGLLRLLELSLDKVSADDIRAAFVSIARDYKNADDFILTWINEVSLSKQMAKATENLL